MEGESNLGSRPPGGVIIHLERTTEATRDYLDWREAEGQGPNAEAEYLSSYTGGDKPDEPQAYTWLKRIRRYGSIFSGGIWNQPYLMSLETTAAENGEGLHLSRVEANRKLRATINAN